MTSQSIYEHLFALTTLMKQRVVENFDGDSLNERWTTFGGGTFAMSDNIDEGFSVTTTTANNNISGIFFNNIRQYSQTGSVLIGVVRKVSSTTTGFLFELGDGGLGGNFARAQDFTTETFKSVRSRDGTNASTTGGTVPIDTSFHTHKLEVNTPSNIKSTIDGILDITKSTNLPTATLQPVFSSNTLTTATRECRIKYLEAFNI